MLIVSAAFMIWGVISLVTRAMTSPVLIAAWLATGAIGMAFAWRFSRMDASRFDPDVATVTMPGSTVPLARNMSIFAAKYVLAVAMAIAPAWAARISLWDIAVSGLSAGFFAGWLARFGAVYRLASSPVVVTSGRRLPSGQPPRRRPHP